MASFSGGAVGVISALMLLEINNVEQQEKKRCKYCHGTGNLFWLKKFKAEAHIFANTKTKKDRLSC